MQTITTTRALKERIQLLELKRTEQGQLLKNQINLVRDSLKTANLIKSTFNEVVSSPALISNILGAILGLSAGYFSNKLFVGSSINRLKRLLGNILQFGITTILTRKPEIIQSVGQHIIHRLFSKSKAVS
jgi:hypothetical protein